MNPATQSLGSYAVHMIGGLAFVIALILVIGVIWHRYVERNLPKVIRRALDNGDERIADIADAMYAARNRPSVPRRLEDTRR